MRARFSGVALLIETHGLERMREPYVKHVEGPIWESGCAAETALVERSM
jgi:hypothetical protein